MPNERKLPDNLFLGEIPGEQLPGLEVLRVLNATGKATAYFSDGRADAEVLWESLEAEAEVNAIDGIIKQLSGDQGIALAANPGVSFAYNPSSSKRGFPKLPATVTAEYRIIAYSRVK